MYEMARTIVAMLCVLWLLGIISHTDGGRIHLLLVGLVGTSGVNFMTGRRTM